MGMIERVLVRYFRLSLEDEREGESDSISNQRKLVDNFIEAQDDLRCMESIELVDDGYTGTNFNRPGVKKLFELLKGNRVACIIVKDFSRFTRDYIELGNYLEQIFPFMEVRFIAINDGYDSEKGNAADGLEVPFKGLLNDLYSKDISAKVMASKRQMIRQGRLCSGSYPFGYRKSDMGDSIYCVDHEAGSIVKYIFRLALEGKRNIEIARILNVERMPTPGVYKRQKGDFGFGLKANEQSIWDSSKINTILRDERYMGTLIIGKHQVEVLGIGKGRKVPEDMWYRKENAMPEIISEEDFNRVQELRPYRKKGSYKKEKHILYRKVRCGCCGKYLYFKPSEYGEQYNSFFCKQSHLDPESKCFIGYIKEKVILHELLCVMQKMIAAAGDLKSEEIRQSGDKKKVVQTIGGMEKKIDVLKAEKVQNYQLYRTGDMGKEDFLLRKDRLQEEIERLEGEIDNVKQKFESTTLADGECMLNNSSSGNVDNLNRELIENMVDTIWVYDVDTIKIQWCFGGLC